MASWQPPIPSGALYSRPARDLGAALALLAWCYDTVQRDGCFTIQLKEVAAELDEPYRTVLKWWTVLSRGPFFATITDRGRAGFHVQFHREWIDWRILQSRGSQATDRFEVPNMVLEDQDGLASIHAQAPNMVLETQKNGFQSALNTSSIHAQAPNMVLEGHVYKVLHDDQESEEEDARTTRHTPAASEEETAVTIYQRITGARDVNKLQRESMSAIANLAIWRATCEYWTLSGYKVRNLPGMLDNYAKRLTEYQQTQAKRNGHSTPRAIPEPYDYSQEESPYSEAYQARLKASMRGAK